MRLDQSTWKDVETYLEGSKGIILPIGSTEQHGPTGLIGTDALCADLVARGVGERADAMVAPPLTFPSTDLLLPSETLAGSASGPAEVVLEIPPTTIAPKIDAVADACWENAPERRIGKKVAGQIDGDADCSGTFKVLHDVDHLYVFFNVRDDKIV
ncbi:MAG: creatininase family protein, partial [Geminicoccaceae bacterium]